MNPEEEFERWWNSGDVIKTDRIVARQAWLIAFRLGHHQGMTRAAEIAAQNTHLIANAILTDRDKEEK